jgi:hypothetical protein
LATIENSSQIDRAFENILNVLFYIVIGCCVLSFLGFDPLALFFSLSSVILAFAFMFSSASAKYFEVRKKEEEKHAASFTKLTPASVTHLLCLRMSHRRE